MGMLFPLLPAWVGEKNIGFKDAPNKCTFSGFTKTPNVTSPDTMLSLSEWSRPAKLSQAACRLLKVGGDRMSAEG